MSALTQTPATYRIPCATVWGGIEPVNLDLATPGIAASLFSEAGGSRAGGDVYYLSVCSSDLLTRVAIADVRGHGDQVSQLSSWLYHALHDKMNTLDGAGVLTDLNRMAHSRGFAAITTAAVVSFYLGDSFLYYSYAGHPPAMVRRLSGHWETLSLDGGSGHANLPLGVLPGARYEQRKSRLHQGDRFFLYTDGLSEAPGPDPDDLFGEERILATLEQTGARDVTHMKNEVVGRVKRHAGEPLTHDDCTLMAFEIL